MKRLILISIFLTVSLLGLMARASDQNALIARADSAYNADDFGQAATYYAQAIKKHGTSATLWYNLGNCHYRLGQMGRAIIDYERALRINPAFQDARDNLELANTKITDRPGERGTFVSNLVDSISQAMRSNLWAWIALGCFGLTVAGAAMYVFTDEVYLRKIGFFGGIVTLFASAFFIFFSLHAADIAISDAEAVITSPSTILSTAPRTPRDRTQEAMLLHEGTKVHILDSVRSTGTDSVPAMWYDVQIDNEHRAWLNSRDAERI